MIRDVESKTLYVGIALAAENSFKDVEVLLERIVPANMQITVGLKYNQYNKFSTFTHEDMQNFTHDQLRNEVE